MGMSTASISAFFLHVPTDWIIIGAFAIIVALDTIRSGSNRAVSLTLALPVALFVQESLSHAVLLGAALQQLTVAHADAIVFAVILVAVYLLTHRIIGFYSDSSGAPLSAVIVGVACAIIATLVWLQTPALFSLWNFGPNVQTIFGEAYRFWWLAGAYLALAFARS